MYISSQNGITTVSITIYTAQMRIDDHNAIDITVKSANTPLGRALAPTWEMVNGLREGRITDEEYTEKYLALLRQRYAQDNNLFHELLRDNTRIVLKCYCPPDTFCHRLIAKDVLIKIAEHIGIQATFGGEIVHQRGRAN
jgi:hypothetical protein